MRTPKPVLERRRSIRIEEALPFKIGHDKFEILAETVNVSEHGALCLVDGNVPVMTQLALALTLPGATKSSKGKNIRMKGVVVRRDHDPASKKYFLAIFFSQISPKDQQVLSRFIESRLSRPKA